MKRNRHGLERRQAASPRWLRYGAGRLLLVLLASAPLLRSQAQSARPAASPRLAPALQVAAASSARHTVRVSVADQAAFRQWVQQHLPAARISQPTASGTTLTVANIAGASLPKLAACPLVQFVDVADRRAQEERRISYSDLSANAVSAVHARFPALAGQGITVSVKERPFDVADIDFKGRVLGAPFAGAPSEHATTMATLIGGGGNSSPLGRGVAWQARLATSDFARLLPDDGQQLTQSGVSVQNHSYGVAIENYYGIEAVEYDRQCRQFPSLLHVFSSGNVGRQASPDGPYQGIANFANLTGQFKMSKNTLSVGATDLLGTVPALSSRGPAYDGRVKPELVAYGDGGSSEAAALVSGTAALLQQAYREQNGGAWPPASLVKAALLNSADDAGRPEVDFVNGYGRLDALGAVRTVRDNRVLGGTLAQGQDLTFTITVPSGCQQLKATLVWADPPAAANASRALVNDLDLELLGPGTGQRWLPWVLSTFPQADSLARPARRGPDHLNNVEQITLALPAAGTYQLRVRGFTVPAGPQAFSLAYETSPTGFEWLRPQARQTLAPGARALVRWSWTGPATTGRLEYRPVSAGQWQPVAAAAPLGTGAFQWNVPDTTALVQLRMVVGSTAYLSDTFAILRAPTVSVGYACPDEALLLWPRVPGAQRYQVYQLGATHLVPFVQTADTSLLITASQLAQRYYAVAPVLAGQPVEPGSTIDFTTQGTACYFRSFRVRELVSDTVRLEVELGSVYRLRTATLERLGPGGYEAVQTLAPPRSVSLAFSDAPPQAGRYVYRVRLETTAGRVIYSSVEEAYLVRPGNVLAFPNPVVAGGNLTLVGSNGAVLTARLYDVLGRVVSKSVSDGTTTQLPTASLRKGMYLLRVSSDGQPSQTIRIVVLE